MNEQTDSQLMRAYAENRSESAFGELVRRHVDFVYSAARRMVCDPHLAEDVTQNVFAVLAKNARQLVDRPVLSGWLHRTAQNIAANAVRTIERRRAREQEAAAMNELPAAESEVSWEHIAPHLDAALGDLSEQDRDALFLRYFERKSAREMAATLGISNEAAQKRVNRAVERLRELFTKRGVTAGASGLAMVMAAHAVQAAPAGLAVTISATATLAGATVATTQALVMTTLQKTIVTAALAAALGTGVYEAKQAANARTELRILQQQQAPLAERIQQLGQALADATNQLVSLRNDNQRPDRNAGELLRLRGEVARLRLQAQDTSMKQTAGSTDAAAMSWLKRADQLRTYVAQHPNEQIPEFQFLTDREWLVTADAGLDTETFEKADDYDRAMQGLRFQAQDQFAYRIEAALREFASTNEGKFPSALAQLQPYCEPAIAELLVQLYEIKPVTVLPPSVIKENNIKTDWVITRTKRVSPNTTSRLAIFANGYTFWQSPP